MNLPTLSHKSTLRNFNAISPLKNSPESQNCDRNSFEICSQESEAIRQSNEPSLTDQIFAQDTFSESRIYPLEDSFETGLDVSILEFDQNVEISSQNSSKRSPNFDHFLAKIHEWKGRLDLPQKIGDLLQRALDLFSKLQVLRQNFKENIDEGFVKRKNF